MIEIERISVQDLPSHKIVKDVSNRQIITFIVPSLIGVLMILFGPNLAKVFGLIFVLFTLAVFIRFKERKVATITETQLIVYDIKNPELCQVIAWEDIFTWDLQSNSGGEDCILIEDHDNKIMYVYLFSPYRITKYIEEYAPKTSKQHRLKDEQNKRGEGNSLKEVINYFGKRRNR